MIVMPDWRRSLTWALRVNLILLVIDLVLLPLSSLLLKTSIFALVAAGFFSVLLLLESGIIFVIGGLVAMSSSIFASKIREHVFHSDEEWSKEKQKRSEARANLYILTGVFLFLESIVSTFVIL